MPAPHLTLCGPITLQVDGHQAGDHPLPTKAVALLAFLAVESGMHSREKLAALLWGESPEAKANASLRQALTSLRRALGEHILISRTRVGLDPVVTSDLRTFLATGRSDPAGASHIEVDRFLEGCTPHHCPTFDEWVDAVRSDLRVRACQAIAAAGPAAIARRDWRDATMLGARWCRLDPASEEATHLLVEALYLSGDTVGALEAHAQFLARRPAEAPSPQSPELDALVQRIAHERSIASVARANDDWHEATRHFEPGLVGRAAEWETLCRAWAGAEAGAGRVVVVEGEVGAGKTRLAEDYARWVTARGGVVLRARAYESGLTTQLGTMLEVLRGAVHHPAMGGADPIALGIVARILPELKRRFPALAIHATDPGIAVMEEAVADLLMAIAEDTPLLVIVDDFHWCDPDTGAMLHYLVRRLREAPVVWHVALTLGHDEHDTPATRVARALRAMPGALRLELGPLSPDDVWEVIRDLGRIQSGTSGRRLAQRLHEVTHGNPFYVIELLKTWLAEGLFSADPATGEWVLSDREDFEVQVGSVSATVHDAIAQRLARLPADQQVLLATIAAHDHGCSPDVLSHVHGMSRLRVSLLGDALEQRFLVGESEGRYSCAHPIIATVVLESMGSARRRELHRAIALALVAAAQDRGTRPEAGEVALHADLGEEGGLAYAHAMQAAQASRMLGATAEALHWLDVASRWAGSRDERAAVDRATSELLGGAEALEARTPFRRRGHTTLSRQDFDLLARPA